MKSLEKNIKILLIMPFFYPHKGGSQKYAEELHAKLIELNPSVNVDVLCYNTKNSPKSEKYRGMNIFRVPCWEVVKDKFLLPHPLKLLKTLKVLNGTKYDFVETHVRFFDPTWWSWIYAKRIGAKSLYVGHVPGHPVHHKKLISSIAKIIDKTLAKWALRKYDLVFYANKACRNFYSREFGLKEEAPIIHISVNTDEFLPKKGGIRSIPINNFKLDKEDVLITYVGRMIETKGVKILLKAIKDLEKSLDAKTWDKIHFCFGGPGNLNIDILNNVKQGGLDKSVSVLGELSYENVKELISISDVFVNPSSFDEGLPNTLLEAGAGKCFVIATDSGSIGDLIKDMENGLLIEKGNPEQISKSIKWFLQNKERAGVFATRLNELISSKYTWEVSALEYEEFLNNSL